MIGNINRAFPTFLGKFSTEWHAQVDMLEDSREDTDY